MAKPNAGVFDLDAEGIALPGRVVRLLAEYAQGDGAAKAIYVKATDLELLSDQEIEAAAAELQRQNQELNSGELDGLVSDLLALAGGEAQEQMLSLVLSEEELTGLAYIADRYGSGEILFDSYDDERKEIPRHAVLDAYLATRDDGGDLGTVPLAGGTLRKKIEQLWDEADAHGYVEELLEESDG